MQKQLKYLLLLLSTRWIKKVQILILSRVSLQNKGFIQKNGEEQLLWYQYLLILDLVLINFLR